MPGYKKYFHSVLNKYYPGKGEYLIRQIDIDFESVQPDISFSKSSKNPVDRRMEIAGYFLSTIKILDGEGVGFEEIKKIATEIALEYVKPKNRVHLFLKKLPAKIVGTKMGNLLLNYFSAKLSGNDHPDGFKVNLLTKKEETLGFGYGFDIIECGICKLFRKHNYQKFVPILCEVDHITSDMAGLTLIRTGTIANGAAKCDFRFRKKQLS
jgi:hypothetical protein